jgi:hypothetical protein
LGTSLPHNARIALLHLGVDFLSLFDPHVCKVTELNVLVKAKTVLLVVGVSGDVYVTTRVSQTKNQTQTLVLGKADNRLVDMLERGRLAEECR